VILSTVMPRLDRGIQYAAAFVFVRSASASALVLGRPVKPGDDS